MHDLQGKRYLVFGVAADTSIAWAICQALADRGALVTLGYQKRFLSRVQALVKDAKFVEAWKECDLSSEESTKTFFGSLSGRYDGVVHAVAFAPAEALAKPIIETTQEDFSTALVISSYSLARVARLAQPHMSHGGSIITLTYLGAERVVPGYRVMGTAKAALESLVRELAASLGPAYGTRVNAISAGPIRTLAASGVPGFDLILGWMESNAPLRRNVTQADVAKAATFLLGPDSSGITGQVLYVDAGYSAVGAPPDLGRVLLEPQLEAPEGPQ
ncbi:MAG: enoyl-ACP reductase FabI [Thermoplasmatota archaeon]